MIHFPFTDTHQNGWKVIVSLMLTGLSMQGVFGEEPVDTAGYLFHHQRTQITLRFPSKPSVMKRTIRQADSSAVELDIFTVLKKDNLAMSFSARPLNNTLDETQVRSYIDRLVASMQASNIIIKKQTISKVSTVHFSATLQRNDMTYFVEQLTFCIRKHLVSVNCTYSKRKHKSDVWKYFKSLKTTPKVDSK